MGNRSHFGTMRTISTVPLDATSQRHHNQPRLGSVGAELTRGLRSGCGLWCAFFQNYGRRGGFKASLNCNRVDEFDRSARSTTSTTQQSTRVRGVGGWNGRGIAWRHRFYKGIFDKFLGGGGRIEVTICDRAGELDRTAQSTTSTTQQSTSACGVGGWNGRGMVWRLRFPKGIFVRKI